MEEKQTGSEHHAGCFFCDIAGPQIDAFLEHCCPQPTRDHFRNARLEMLKGFRSLLDTRIDRLSKRGQKGTPVTVE